MAEEAGGIAVALSSSTSGEDGHRWLRVNPCTICLHRRSQHHAPPQGFIRKYVFSLDHKVIGKQYYALALVAVFIGMVLSWIMRIHLGWPTVPFPACISFPRTGPPAA